MLAVRQAHWEMVMISAIVFACFALLIKLAVWVRPGLDDAARAVGWPLIVAIVASLPVSLLLHFRKMRALALEQDLMAMAACERWLSISLAMRGVTTALAYVWFV